MIAGSLVINWLVPEPFPGAGGDVGIFRMISHLAEFGHRCRAYVVAYGLMNEFSDAEVRAYVSEHFGPTRATYFRFHGQVKDADITFATFWPTAEALLKLSNSGQKYYLIQDFEPAFYPKEPHHYERAEVTYQSNLRCITLGPWLTKLLRSRYQAVADHFDFAVDSRIYHPHRGRGTRNPSVSFYARPATPRRAYEMGVAALGRVKERIPESEICFFGSDELLPEPPYPHRNLGKLNQTELAHLFARSDVGVVLSLSNPSFVPLEMMACGCAVVEVASERWNGVLAHGENALLVAPSVAAVARGVIELIENSSLREKLIRNGTALTERMSWCDSARQIESILQRETTRRIESKALALPSRNFRPCRYGLGAWTDHIYFAYDLVAELKPTVLVELGTDRGESYFAFCQSISENRTETRAFAIDHWRGDPHAGSYDETTFREVESHNRSYYSSFSVLLRSTFDEALAQFADESIDLLHLDGHHSEEAARHDLQKWLPKLRPGGILLVHDVTMRKRGFGVWKVWEELATEGRAWTFESGPGLGVWEKPPVGTVPFVLGVLFGPPNEQKDRLLEHYRECGRELQTRVAQEWATGSIRSAPMASETVIQIFWTADGNYSEENSVDARVGHESWKEIAISLPVTGPVTGLRIDFFSALTRIEISGVRCENLDGTVIYQAEDAEAFAAIRLEGDCIRVDTNPLVIEITGVDPQLYLPAFASSTISRVTIRLRVQASQD